MDGFSLHRGRSPEDPAVVVLRIMRFMSVTIPVPMRIEPTVSAGTLAVRRGARVAVGGVITAGGFGARLTYRQVEPGASVPVEEVASERIALLHRRTLALPPRAIERSATGRAPGLWVQFLDGGGTPITTLTHLGRSDQGPFDLCPNVTLGLFVDAAIVKSAGSDPYSEPILAIAGEICIRAGIVARVMLSEDDRLALHPSNPSTPADVALFPGGTEVQLPRRMLRGQLGPDSWIFVTFLDGTGQPIGGESLLGAARAEVMESALYSSGAPEARAHGYRGGR